MNNESEKEPFPVKELINEITELKRERDEALLALANHRLKTANDETHIRNSERMLNEVWEEVARLRLETKYHDEADALRKLRERERDEARKKWKEQNEALRTLAEHGESEMQKLIKERDEAREENKKFREALEWIVERYENPMHTHQVAMDAYEMSCTARAALRMEEAK